MLFTFSPITIAVTGFSPLGARRRASDSASRLDFLSWPLRCSMKTRIPFDISLSPNDVRRLDNLRFSAQKLDKSFDLVVGFAFQNATLWARRRRSQFSNLHFGLGGADGAGKPKSSSIFNCYLLATRGHDPFD